MAPTTFMTMAQTLLAVLALGLVMLLALNTNRDRVSRISKTVAGTLEVEARGVAAEALDHIGGFLFDGNTGATTTDGFTSEVDFGPPGRAFDDPSITDIDDFHGAAVHVIERAVSDPNTGEQVPLGFAITVDVQYVTVSTAGVSPSGGVATYDKQVEVTVSNDRMTSPISLSLVFSFSE